MHPNQVRWGNRDDERREDVVQWSSILNLFWSECLQSTRQGCSIQYLFNSQSCWKWPHRVWSWWQLGKICVCYIILRILTFSWHVSKSDMVLCRFGVKYDKVYNVEFAEFWVGATFATCEQSQTEISGLQMGVFLYLFRFLLLEISEGRRQNSTWLKTRCMVIWSKLASWIYSGITLDIKVFSLWRTS